MLNMVDFYGIYTQTELLFFFLVVYIHVFRGLYYGSYITPRRAVWNVGVIILLIMILTAFLGYVLP